MVFTLKDDYEKFLELKRNHITNNEIDTCNENFLAPTTLIPLLYIAKHENKQIKYNDSTNTYITRIINNKDTQTTSFISNKNDDQLFMNLPIEQVQRQKEESNEKFVDKLDHEYGGLWFQRYVLEELTTNIYEHAYQRGKIDVGVNYAQVYPRRKLMDLCIYDAGKSIPGNYEDHDQKIHDDCHAIEKALLGVSTGYCENMNYTYQRGNGIRTVINKLITENNGEALIASRNAYIHIQSKTKYEYKSCEPLKGTLITLRLKQNRVKQFMDLGEMMFLNPYRYLEEGFL